MGFRIKKNRTTDTIRLRDSYLPQHPEVNNYLEGVWNLGFLGISRDSKTNLDLIHCFYFIQGPFLVQSVVFRFNLFSVIKKRQFMLKAVNSVSQNNIQ